MDNIPLPTQLLPCLAIPFVELFPGLCLGWWTPPSLNLNQYKKMWYLRISLQFIAWFPIFELLLPMSPDGSTFSLLVLGTVASIVFRNILLNKQIDRVVNTPLWSTNLPRDKREALFVVISNTTPTDINRFDDMASKYAPLPTRVAGAVMYGIVNLIHQQFSEKADKMKLMVAFAAFIIGGIGIGGTRHGSTSLDCLFRCVLGAGFIAILQATAEVSDIMLIKSIS